jgi:signal transduction histidine kinase
MAWSFRPGIRTQIVFTLTILMAGAVAFVGFLFLKVEERNLMDQKIREGKQIVGALQRSLQDLAPESHGKPFSENLGRVVFLFAQGHPHLHFTVVSRDFDILADSRPEQVGKVLRDIDLEKAMAFGKILAHGAGSEESFSLMKRTPLLISSAWLLGDQTVGGIRAEIPLEDLKETLFRSQSIIFLYVFLTAILLIVMGSFLLSRVIIKPLKKLMQMSDKIAEGNLELMSGPSGGNEVGRVLASFNHMISRLREDRSKMEEYIASLKKVNRELRLAQEGIIRSEKLASIGRLAAGVAHEVGNPTGAILGYLDLLSKGGVAEAEKAEVLKRAELEAERIRRIVRELLEFSRPSPRREEEVEVNTVIDRALSLLSHQKKVWEQIHVIRAFQKDLPRWQGNPHHLQQVMINLFLNAADALVAKDPAQAAGEKKIRITTQALLPGELVDSLSPGTWRKKDGSPGADSSLFGIDRDVHLPLLQEVSSILQVDVEDSGPGIPAERLGRIFEPFYSTKPPGEGTGLGLAICLGILESYGGKISVQSESGKGARFTILLPIFE